MKSSRLGVKAWNTVIFEEVEQLVASRQQIHGADQLMGSGRQAVVG